MTNIIKYSPRKNKIKNILFLINRYLIISIYIGRTFLVFLLQLFKPVVKYITGFVLTILTIIYLMMKFYGSNTTTKILLFGLFYIIAYLLYELLIIIVTPK